MWSENLSKKAHDYIIYGNQYAVNSDKLRHIIFKFFLIFNYSIFTSRFKIHHRLNFYGVIGKKNNIILINFLKLFYRWSDSYDFLFNMLYYQMSPLVFGSPVFKKEILSLNWNYGAWTLDFWKYYSNFFIFQPNKYHVKTNFFFAKIKTFDVNFFLITDCLYQQKNLFYFKKNNYYTVGLVNANSNPAIVSYPIISFFEGYLVQSFFLKLLVYAQKQAQYHKYLYFKQIWSFLVYTNVFNLN